MDKPLSISGFKRFTTCPQMYNLYDVQGDRPIQNSSALAVGSIVDKVVEGQLLGKDVDFRQEVLKYLDKRVEFFDHDLDVDFIDQDSITKMARKMGWKGDDIGKALKSFMSDQSNLSDNQYKLLHAATWQSLDIKIEAMLASFNKWILPKISNPRDMQKHLDDGITHGYMDFVVDLKDGRDNVLLDLKTSRNAYQADAVAFSPQLHLYAAMNGNDYAGFVVLVKTLKKNKQKWCKPCSYETSGGNRTKCPKCKETLDFQVQPTSFSQLLVEEITPFQKELTKTAMYDTIKCIDNGVFPKNLNTCKWVYGKPCQYINKCWRKNEK